MVSSEDLGWLAGFFDGEGYITTRARNQLQLGVDNTDRALLERAQSILDGLEIDSILSPRPQRKPEHKPIFRLTVQSLIGIRRFFKKVPIQSKDKLDHWDELCSTHLTRSAEHTKARRARLTRSYPSLL